MKSEVAWSDAGVASDERPPSKSDAPYDQNWVANPVYIVCQAPVPRWANPRTLPPVLSTTARAVAKYWSQVSGTSRPARSSTSGTYARLYDSQFTGNLQERPCAERVAEAAAPAVAEHEPLDEVRRRRIRHSLSSRNSSSGFTNPAARCSQTRTGPDM